MLFRSPGGHFKASLSPVTWSAPSAMETPRGPTEGIPSPTPCERSYSKPPQTPHTLAAEAPEAAGLLPLACTTTRTSHRAPSRPTGAPLVPARAVFVPLCPCPWCLIASRASPFLRRNPRATGNSALASDRRLWRVRSAGGDSLLRPVSTCSRGAACTGGLGAGPP